MRRGDKQGDDARAHLAEAERIAARIGECNGMRMHFGPTNIALWRLAVGIELGEGGRAYAEPPGHRRTWPCSTAMAVLNSKDRASTLAFDLARALVQDGAQRDAEAIRHLDTADRLAPSRIRNDPIARDLVLTLDRRARRQAWAGQPAPPLRYPRAGLTPLGTAGSGHCRLWAPPALGTADANALPVRLGAPINSPSA
ncbi:MAG: hypothetical protein JO281_20205 [Pseudonocardiales bacterium]|nr:hypothetical protein [Pseudonocardiales bacterium]